MQRCRQLVATLSLIALLSACGSPSEDPGPVTSAPLPKDAGVSSSPAELTEHPTTTDPTEQSSDCPQNYGEGLQVWTDQQVEVEYLEDVVACTDVDHRFTYLENKGDVVWKPRVTGWSATVTYYKDTLTARAYRDVVSDHYAYALLTPGQNLVVSASPETVGWDLDLPLSLSYQVHATLVSELQRYGEGALVAGLNKRTPRGAAVAGCVISGYNIAKDAPDLAEKPPAEWVMLGISGAAGVSTCTSSWRQADAVEARAGQEVALTADELPNIRFTQAAALERADKYLTRATYMNKIVQVLLKVS